MAGIDGKMYGEMVISAANALENQKEDINNLNVFPVPDGDTGSNMSMTIGVVREKAENLPDKLSDCAAQISRMMLMAARGNSGVILSLFFKGMAKALDECDEADSVSLAKAFQSGVDSAYGAVMTPQEGTILTVMRVSAEKALEKVLVKVQAANPEVFVNAPKYAGVQELGASAVILRVTASVDEGNRFQAARLLNRGLKEGMEELGISCPYNQLVVHKAD